MAEYYYGINKKVPAYAGPLFELQPIPGGQPQDFYEVSPGVLNTQADGLGESLEDWVAENTTEEGTADYYYKSCFDQHGSLIKATALPGERPMMGEGFNINQFMRANTPEFGFLTFAAREGAGVSNEATP